MSLAKPWCDLDRSTVGNAPNRYALYELGDADGETIGFGTGVLRDELKEALAYRDAERLLAEHVERGVPVTGAPTAGGETDRQTKVPSASMTGMSDEAETDDEVMRASDIGGDGPPIEEKPYKIVFEANKCFGAGKCAEVADNWVMDIQSEMAKPQSYYIGEEELDENIRAAEACPAKKETGVIHVVDRRTDEEIAPDPHDDGTLSVDW